MKKKNIALTLGIMCLALTMAIAVQFRTISDANKVVGSNVNSELKTEVLRWKERYEELYEDLDEFETMLEEKRKLATSNDKISKEFYYLGHMQASGKVREFVMPNTDKTAVEIEWLLDVPVREDLYEYIVNE